MQKLIIFTIFFGSVWANNLNYDRSKNFSEAGESKFERIERVEEEVYHLFQEAKLNQQSRSDLDNLTQKLGSLERLLMTIKKVEELQKKVDEMAKKIEKIEVEMVKHHPQRDITIEN